MIYDRRAISRLFLRKRCRGFSRGAVFSVQNHGNFGSSLSVASFTRLGMAKPGTVKMGFFKIRNDGFGHRWVYNYQNKRCMEISESNRVKPVALTHRLMTSVMLDSETLQAPDCAMIWHHLAGFTMPVFGVA